jgi:hypothetical protein
VSSCEFEFGIRGRRGKISEVRSWILKIESQFN